MFDKRQLGRLTPFTPRNLFLRQKAKRHKQMAIATIDTESLFSLRRGAHKRSLSIMDLKYFDIDYWIEESLFRAMDHELDRKRNIRLLDIGTGFGYFPYLCNYLGNHGYAIDRSGHQLYDEVCEVLGIDRVTYTIQPQTPLQTLFDQKFDLVTAYQIGFDLVPGVGFWSPEDWDFFLREARDKWLAPGGKLFLALNYKHRYNDWYTPGVREVLRSHGARMRLGQVVIQVPADDKK